MTDVIDLALQYGGFTALDRAYLEKQLAGLPREQQLTLITPPPSVLNAYFAELYQKQGPQAATDYYFGLSRALGLLGKTAFAEETLPFIRLNLSGRSYGLVYENEAEQACVFPELPEPADGALLLEVAPLFPHYKAFLEDGAIKLAPLTFDEDGLVLQEQTAYPLSDIFRSAALVKIQGFNQDEVLAAARDYTGRFYYGFLERQFLIYIVN